MDRTPEEQKALLELLGWGDPVWRETIYRRALSVQKRKELCDDSGDED